MVEHGSQGRFCGWVRLFISLSPPVQRQFNAWIPRERLIELGFSKIVQQFDDFESSREGSGSRELSGIAVREHLEALGLDGNIAEYNEMSGLSGGQKVKVVIAAALWAKPQVLILDEPYVCASYRRCSWLI